MRGMPLLSVTMANPQVKPQPKAKLAEQAKAPPKALTKALSKTQLKTKGSKVNRAWINDHVNDPYVKLAKREGYRARAAYKLKEIDETFNLIKPGHLVVDLGSVPGAWSQYLRRKFLPKPAPGTGAAGGVPPGALNGTVIALDILPMEPIEGVVFLQGDFREAEMLDRLVQEMAGRLADVVVSDMAPNLSGIDSADTARIEHLVELAIDFTQAHMKQQGALVAKVFHGSGYDTLVRLFKQSFLVVKPVKPKASRDKSSETFLVGIGLKVRQPPP
jgi:23S rRNA (uridine2552-2'-O)-methyltransferase